MATPDFAKIAQNLYGPQGAANMPVVYDPSAFPPPTTNEPSYVPKEGANKKDANKEAIDFWTQQAARNPDFAYDTSVFEGKLTESELEQNPSFQKASRIIFEMFQEAEKNAPWWDKNVLTFTPKDGKDYGKLGTSHAALISNNLTSGLDTLRKTTTEEQRMALLYMHQAYHQTPDLLDGEFTAETTWGAARALGYSLLDPMQLAAGVAATKLASLVGRGAGVSSAKVLEELIMKSLQTGTVEGLEAAVTKATAETIKKAGIHEAQKTAQRAAAKEGLDQTVQETVQRGAQQALQTHAEKTLVARVGAALSTDAAKAGAVSGGLQGAPIGAGLDYTQQKIALDAGFQDGYNWKQGLTAGSFGAIIGTGLGGSISASMPYLSNFFRRTGNDFTPPPPTAPERTPQTGTHTSPADDFMNDIVGEVPEGMDTIRASLKPADEVVEEGVKEVVDEVAEEVVEEVAEKVVEDVAKEVVEDGTKKALEGANGGLENTLSQQGNTTGPQGVQGGQQSGPTPQGQGNAPASGQSAEGGTGAPTGGEPPSPDGSNRRRHRRRHITEGQTASYRERPGNAPHPAAEPQRQVAGSDITPTSTDAVGRAAPETQPTTTADTQSPIVARSDVSAPHTPDNVRGTAEPTGSAPEGPHTTSREGSEPPPIPPRAVKASPVDQLIGQLDDKMAEILMAHQASPSPQGVIAGQIRNTLRDWETLNREAIDALSAQQKSDINARVATLLSDTNHALGLGGAPAPTPTPSPAQTSPRTGNNPSPSPSRNGNHGGGTADSTTPPPPAPPHGGGGHGGGGMGGRGSPPMSEDFPKFEPRFDVSKLKHRLIGHSPFHGFNPLNWAPIHLSRRNSVGIVKPVIQFVDNTMASSRLTDKILKLNADVLDAYNKGQDSSAITKLIDDFGHDNAAQLDAVRDNLRKLQKHVQDTYDTNEVTRWTFDLGIAQKEALVKFIKEMGTLCDDMKSGIKGKNGQEILRNIERIKNGELNPREVGDSITGLSRSHFWLADSKIRETGQWLDNSGPAWEHWKKRLQREINLGIFNHHEYTDKTPIIYNAKSERGLRNSETGENLENPWQLFIEAAGKRDEDGYLVNKIAEGVEGKWSYVEDLDTIISGGFGNTAVESVWKLTRLLQSKVKNTDSATPYPTLAKWDRAVAAESDVSPWKKFYFDAIGNTINVGERTKPSAADDTWLKIKERWWERNRYTQAKLEANRYFWDFWEEFQTASAPAKPAWLQLKTAARYYFLKPFLYMAGASKYSVEKKDIFGFNFPNYYKGRTLEWRRLNDPADPKSKEGFLTPFFSRTLVRVPSGFLFSEWKPIVGRLPFYKTPWVTEWVGLKPTLLGKSATVGAYLMAAGSVTGLVSTDLLDWANETPNAGLSPYIQAAAPFAKSITPSLNSTSQGFMDFSNLYGWVPNPSKMAYDAAYDSVKEKISGGKTESPSSKDASEINQDAMDRLNRHLKQQETPHKATPTGPNVILPPPPPSDFMPRQKKGGIKVSYNIEGQMPAFNYAATAQTNRTTDWKSEHGLTDGSSAVKPGANAFNTASYNISGKTGDDGVQWGKITTGPDDKGPHAPTEFTV